MKIDGGCHCGHYGQRVETMVSPCIFIEELIRIGLASWPSCRSCYSLTRRGSNLGRYRAGEAAARTQPAQTRGRA